MHVVLFFIAPDSLKKTMCVVLFFMFLLSQAAGTPPPNIKDKQYWKHVEAVGAKTSPSQRVTVYDSVGYPQQSRFVYCFSL